MRDSEGSPSVPIVVIKEEVTKVFGAHVCTQKGNVEWVADRLVEDIDLSGNQGAACIKSD